MPRKQPANAAQLAFLDVHLKTAPCVPALRQAVFDWRARNYEGVSDTTRALLNFWFRTDHRLANRRRFEYHPAQKEAMETLIYLYEVAQVHRHKALLERFAPAQDLRLLQHDDFARYCIKMATGSGKTKVMALTIAWQYFNAVVEGRDDFARTSLIIAPNVIVFERLRLDFGDGRIFRVDPVLPPELQIYWDFECYMRGDPERASSQGALYLTNVQQFYERPKKEAGEEPEEITAVLGPRPPTEKIEAQDFDQRVVARGGPVLVLNDEAHHTHDEESEWNKVIRRLHGDVQNGVVQLDFTATPRHSKGVLFTWTVFDYPLKQAITDTGLSHYRHRQKVNCAV